MCFIQIRAKKKLQKFILQKEAFLSIKKIEKSMQLKSGDDCYRQQ